MAVPDLNTSRPTNNLRIFLDRRIITVFCFGMLSGLPWVMIGSALTLWLKEAGVSRTDIGYAGFIFTVFAINFLWSPLLDQVRLPLFRKLGSRRNWIFLCQILIAASCLLMSTLSPASGVKIIVLTALLIAIAAATQDIAIDAYRVDLFDAKDAAFISAGAAAATSGWWTAFAGLGMVPLLLSDQGWKWPQLYLLMGVTTLVLASCIFWSPAPPTSSRQEHLNKLQQSNRQLMALTSASKRNALLFLLLAPIALAIWTLSGNTGLPTALVSHPLWIPAVVVTEVALFLGLLWYLHQLQHQSSGLGRPNDGVLTAFYAWLLTTVVAPFDDFFQRNGTRLALSLLLFIVLFKLGEAFLGRMSIVFYKEVGFSNTEIAAYSKLLTWGITMAGAIPCALLNARFGLVKGLVVSGIFMAASNLMFSVLAFTGPNVPMFIATIVVDGLTTAWASVAFVGFISMLCSHTFSATQYALMSSLASLGRTTLAAFSGQMVDGLGGNWALFFAITAFMVVPSLLILIGLKKALNQLYSGAKKEEQ